MTMEIRSITYFDNPHDPLRGQVLTRAAKFNSAASAVFEAAGYTVQTQRFATPPFPHLLEELTSRAAVSYTLKLQDHLQEAGFDYLALGPALPNFPESYPIIPDLIQRTENVFASGLMTDPDQGVHLPSVRACGEIIQRLSTSDPQGFDNLYFAALGNVAPGAPFFPAAYHGTPDPAFALAIEGGDLAVQAFSSAAAFSEARENLIQTLENHGRILSGHAEELCKKLGVRFGGIDFSLAPFPEVERSLGTALERLGGMRLGYQGTLTAAAFLADTIDRARFPRTGFSGLMLPVLEDAVFALRGEEGSLSVKDLLLYSAVCGTGLDTIPLPGDLSAGQISALLCDLAALSCRLAKPLTARLMLIPGKKAGDQTAFDFPYFANSKIFSLDSEGLGKVFQQSEYLDLQPRSLERD